MLHIVLPKDARYYQISILTGLLVYGLWRLEFDVSAAQVALTFGVALLAQGVASDMVDIPFEPKSALISSLSLCLLLRVESLWVAGAAAAIAMLSKFMIRYHGRHIFNPTNIALVVAVLLSGNAWISPGQWGHTAWLVFLFVSCGMLVTYRVQAVDVTLAFLAFYAAILFGRALWLGDPLSIPLHQMQSGALLLFAFFMISDPMTIPHHRNMRLFFAAITAAIAAVLQFAFYIPVAIVYALALSAPLVPILNYVCPAEPHAWCPIPHQLRRH